MSEIFNNFGVDSKIIKKNHHYKQVSITGEKLQVQKTSKDLLDENFFNEPIPNINQMNQTIDTFVTNGYSEKTARATVETLKQGTLENNKQLTDTYNIVNNTVVLTELGKEIINAKRDKNVQIVESATTPTEVSNLIKG